MSSSYFQRWFHMALKHSCSRMHSYFRIFRFLNPEDSDYISRDKRIFFGIGMLYRYNLYIYILHYTYNTFLSTCYSHLNRHLFMVMLSVLIRFLYLNSFDFLQTTKPFHRLPDYTAVLSYSSCLASLAPWIRINLSKG